MPTVTRRISRSPDACWRSFTDAALLPAWVPGLRRARIISTLPSGLAEEVAFEFSASNTYSLVYRYDAEARRVTWEPRVGVREAVRGEVSFAPAPDGCLMTYTLEAGAGRSPADRTLDDPTALADSFAAWMSGAG